MSVPIVDGKRWYYGSVMDVGAGKVLRAVQFRGLGTKIVIVSVPIVDCKRWYFGSIMDVGAGKRQWPDTEWWDGVNEGILSDVDLIEARMEVVDRGNIIVIRTMMQEREGEANEDGKGPHSQVPLFASRDAHTLRFTSKTVVTLAKGGTCL